MKMHFRKPLTVLLGLVFLQAGLAQLTEQSPRNNGSDGGHRFKSRSAFVVVPVVVQRNGKHMGGLTLADFAIFEDGAEKTITSVDEVRSVVSSATLGRSPDLSHDDFTNLHKTSGSPRLSVIVLRLSADTGVKSHRNDGVLAFLDQRTTIDPVALVAVGNGVRVIHDFTTDSALLAASLRAAQHGLSIAKHRAPSGSLPPVQPSVGISDSEAAEVRRVQDSFSQDEESDEFYGYPSECADVEAVRTLARALASVPGRKSLIWLGVGPLQPPTNSNSCKFSTEEALLELATANMSIYVISSRGLIAATPFDHPGNTGLLAKHSTSQQDITWTAEATGGKAYFNYNNLSEILKRAIDDSSEYYQLTYRLSNDLKPGWHKLKVQVNQQGVEVRSRNGFLIRKPQSDTDSDDLKRALDSPFMQTELPLFLSWRASDGDSPGAKRIMFKVSIPATALLVDDTDQNHLSISLSGIAIGTDGRKPILNKEVDGHLSVGTLSQFEKTGINYDGAFELPPGVYEVRFAVRDNISGKVGTVIATLEAK